MYDWRVIGPGIRREESGADVILYEPLAADNFSALWFEPDWWAGRGALRGAGHGRGSTWFIDEGGRSFALRHYRRGGFAARLSEDRFWYGRELGSRPLSEFLLNVYLYANDLPVPAPIAARLRREGWFYRGDLITTLVPGARTLAEDLALGMVPVHEWLEVGRTIARFHKHGVFHADLNAHNILIDGSRRVWLIDFDRGGLREPGLWCDANLARLRRSILKVCDPLPAGRFNETLWTALLAGYRDVRPPRRAVA